MCKCYIPASNMEKRGIIYRYTFPNGKQYIGQTVKTLAERTAGHVWDAKHIPDKGCVKLSHAMIKYEFQFEREVMIECVADNMNSLVEKLNALEAEFIKQHNTIEDGYNIRMGGNNVPHDPQIVAKRAKSLRKNNEDKDLPMYTKREMKRGKIRWRISKHPLCSSEIFDTREEMLEKLGKYERGEVPPRVAKPKKIKTTPDHIYERKNGYVIEHKGAVLASFLNVKLPKEELLELAKAKVQQLLLEGKLN